MNTDRTPQRILGAEINESNRILVPTDFTPVLQYHAGGEDVFVSAGPPLTNTDVHRLLTAIKPHPISQGPYGVIADWKNPQFINSHAKLGANNEWATLMRVLPPVIGVLDAGIRQVERPHDSEPFYGFIGAWDAYQTALKTGEIYNWALEPDQNMSMNQSLAKMPGLGSLADYDLRRRAYDMFTDSAYDDEGFFDRLEKLDSGLEGKILGDDKLVVRRWGNGSYVVATYDGFVSRHLWSNARRMAAISELVGQDEEYKRIHEELVEIHGRSLGDTPARQFVEWVKTLEYANRSKRDWLGVPHDPDHHDYNSSGGKVVISTLSGDKVQIYVGETGYEINLSPDASSQSDRLKRITPFRGKPELVPVIVWSRNSQGERRFVYEPVMRMDEPNYANLQKILRSGSTLLGFMALTYFNPEIAQGFPTEMGFPGGGRKQLMQEAQVPLLAMFYEKSIMRGEVLNQLEEQFENGK